MGRKRWKPPVRVDETDKEPETVPKEDINLLASMEMLRSLKQDNQMINDTLNKKLDGQVK